MVNDIVMLSNMMTAVGVLSSLACMGGAAFGYQCLACFVKDHPAASQRRAIVKARSLYLTACIGGGAFALDEFLWLYGRWNSTVPLHVGALSGIAHSVIVCMLLLAVFQGVDLARDVVSCVREADYAGACSSCRDDVGPMPRHGERAERITRVK